MTHSYDPLRSALKERGFEIVGTGGGCEAMYRFDGTESMVVTDHGGTGVPSEDEWMFAVHDGDWMCRDDDTEPKDFGDSESSLVDLIFYYDACSDMAKRKAENHYAR